MGLKSHSSNEVKKVKLNDAANFEEPKFNASLSSQHMKF